MRPRRCAPRSFTLFIRRTRRSDPRAHGPRSDTRATDHPPSTCHVAGHQETRMPFDLRVTFTGLCLFTLDRLEKPAGRLHAVLINYGGENAGGSVGGSATGHPGHRPRHYPRLVYDKAYETQRSTALARRLACRELDGSELRIDDQGDAFRPVIPPEVVDLNEIARVGTLDRRYVEPNPGPAVIARVRTNVGGFTRIGRIPAPQWTAA